MNNLTYRIASMIELYAITVHYIFSRCFKKIGKDTDDLKVDNWVRPLYLAINRLMADKPDENQWFDTIEETRLKYLRQRYAKAQALLQKSDSHYIMRLTYSSFRPVLLMADVNDGYDELNQLFKPNLVPKKFTLHLFKGVTQKITYNFVFPIPPPPPPPDPGPSLQPALRFRVPPRPTFFLGRKALLEGIHQRLAGNNNSSNALLLYGVGGMGKTTVMQEYLYQTHCLCHFNRIIVAPVNKNLKQAFISAAAQALGLEEEKRALADEGEQLNMITGMMSKLSADNNLFVLDNINEYDYDDLVEIQTHLSETGWKFIITSRAFPDSYSGLNIDELNDEDASLLFAYHYFPGDFSLLGADELQEHLLALIAQNNLAGEIKDLLNHILKHTLLTELLAKAGEKKGLSLPELLQSLKARDFKHPKLQRIILIGQNGKTLSNDTLHNYLLDLFETEYLTTNTGIDAIDAEHMRKIDVLRFFSVLPATDIPIDDLCFLWGVKDDDVNDFEDRLDQLRQIGWLQTKNLADEHKSWSLPLKKTSYKMHPLIQQVIYEKLPPTKDTCDILKQAISNISCLPPASAQAYLHYAQSINKKLESLKLSPGNLEAANN